MHGYLCIHIIYYIKLLYIYKLLLCINHCLSCVILIYYTVKLCVYMGVKYQGLFTLIG